MLRIAPGAARMVLAKMPETRRAVVAYIFTGWKVESLEGVELRSGVEDLLMVWMFLTVLSDADAGGKDRKREYYMSF